MEQQTQEALDLNFTKEDFTQVEGPAAEALLKMVAFHEIERTKDKALQKMLSLKYQVVCDETAIVGVMKQANKATGEPEESVVKFGRETFKSVQQDYDSKD